MSDQYCYDVFLSHCSADDAVAQDLCERLTDDGLRVFIDHRDIAPGEDFNLKIEFGLDNSRVLVVLMSTHMRDSQWVGREFVSSTADDPRNRSRRVVPLRLDDSAAPFGLKLLQDIDWRATCRDQNYPRVLKACQKRKKVLVSAPTEDLQQQVKDFKIYLESFAEFDVKPILELNDLDDFKRQFELALCDADLFVQLLGSSPGRDGLAQFQSETAKQTAGLTVMRWRPIDLKLSAISDQQHRDLLQTAETGLLSRFQMSILDWAHKISPAARTSKKRCAFINFEIDDQEIAAEISQICSAYNLDAVTPMKGEQPKKARKNLDGHLRESHVLFFLYGQAPYSWARGQLENYIKMERESDPLLVVICLLPPPPKDSLALGVTIAGKHARLLDCSKNWDPKRIRELLEEIQ